MRNPAARLDRLEKPIRTLIAQLVAAGLTLEEASLVGEICVHCKRLGISPSELFGAMVKTMQEAVPNEQQRQ